MRAWAGAPDVFEWHRRPWILPDADVAGAVAEVVRRCPSGALQYRRLDGQAQGTPPGPPVVARRRIGPLLVHGSVAVHRADGTTEVLPRATLCRCGLSKNKPFCDNSHLAGGFVADGGPIKFPASPVHQRRDRPIDRQEDPRGAE